MNHIADASTLPLTWWKSTYSDSTAQCVECGIADAAGRLVAVRDSKVPTGPALLVGFGALGALVDAVRDGRM
ncbi:MULTISPECIES: DUF397 domain-containing protein [unclassified Streptomyces]|uniref:DUF397 domain-containing protein n=1 Tax=unclassified Streptomyces TaxID=2593676 RepID=UPI001660A862|nr:MULTISPECIES: DUF397 domain-containing protein [unclassified Streptomyces]MBD0707246.1 DUF397 domain-containing protein [Streptomyces sp. CBMA291]MBD0713734.1 DUF397 domain-containing protein [Streptomyces sp. CBMA370]